MENVEKFKPVGPWVLLRVEKPPEKSDSGLLYLPAGNLEERLGQAIGRVLRVGSGKIGPKGRRVHSGLEPSMRVYFRGYLQELHRPGGFLDREHCIVHMDDISLIVEDGE